MIDVDELRIGNIVDSKKMKKHIKIAGVREDNVVFYADAEKGIYELIAAKDLHPILLDDKLLRQYDREGILDYDSQSTKDKLVYFFSGRSLTYFMVNDRDRGGYFIGMTDIDHKTGYRRLTQTFDYLHELQNAYYVIYHQELKIV